MAWVQSALVVDDEVVVDAVEGGVVVEAGSAFAGVGASSVEVVSPAAPSPDESPLDDAGVARRSFFAQPEPLKCTAGAAIALRTGPEPHKGHVAGGSPYTPWIASNRRPHAEQS
jgi:hypothetical protein